MGSTLVQPRTNGASWERLSSCEQIFVKELIADDLWRPTQAARKAGYKNPSQSAYAIMKKPAIQAMLGKEQRRRLEKIGMRADEVLEMLRNALFFNPLSLFKPTSDGKWAVEDLDKIPDEIGRCVSKIKTKTVDAMDSEGNVTSTTYFELELMDKGRLLELALKHCGIDGTTKINVSGSIGVDINLAQLLQGLEQNRSNVIDGKVIESKVIETNANSD